MPGFTKRTGGLIIDTSITQQSQSYQNKYTYINSTLPDGETIYQNDPEQLIGTVFTYIRGLKHLVRDCISIQVPVYLLIFGEKSIKSIRNAVRFHPVHHRSSHSFSLKNITIIEMPIIPQTIYGTLLCHTDFNIVRGEDSLTRAILAGKPFIWNAYIQDNCNQIVKVNALCQIMHQWFKEQSDFESYTDLMIRFNNAPTESLDQITNESFPFFFANLKKIEQIITEMSYFMRQNCNLVKKIARFIRDYP